MIAAACLHAIDLKLPEYFQAILNLRSSCDSNRLLCFPWEWTKPAWLFSQGRRRFNLFGSVCNFHVHLWHCGMLSFFLAPMKDKKPTLLTDSAIFVLLSNRCPQGVWCYAVCLHDRWRMEAAAVMVVYFLMSWVVHFVGCIVRIPVSWSKPCKHECTWVLRCCIARKEHRLPPNPNIPENFGSSWIKSLQIFQCRFASHTLPDFLRNLQVLIDADAAS